MCIAAWNREKVTKTRYFRFQGRSRSSMLIPAERSSAVHVMISSKSVSSCNCSDARLDDSSKNGAFWRGIQIWCPPTKDFLNLECRNLHCWNLRLMLKVLSRFIDSDFGAVHSWNLCRSLKSHSLKPSIFGVQGRSRSSMLIPPEIPQCLLW